MKSRKIKSGRSMNVLKGIGERDDSQTSLQGVVVLRKNKGVGGCLTNVNSSTSSFSPLFYSSIPNHIYNKTKREEEKHGKHTNKQ